MPLRSANTISSLLVALLFLGVNAIAGPTYYVSPSGNNANPGTAISPWRTIQFACDHATAGGTIYLAGGVYNEKISITTSGSASAGFLTLTALDSGTAIIDGTGITGDQLILIQNQQYVRVKGLELRNNLDQTFGTGIWVQGSGDHIEILNNIIHDMRAASGGGDAMGISVYGSSTTPITNVVVRGNTICNCEPGHSESLVMNGNVDTFTIENNIVHDVDNIGIVMIGGEKTCSDPAQDKARNGICRGNLVYNAHSNYGGGYAGGIYVDGGQNILVERNIVHDADVGIEIGCENKGVTASGMKVRDNLLYHNGKRGLSLGGYNFPSTGRVINSVFTNNTMFNNDILGTGEGEIYIEYALNCTLKNNIAYARRNRLITSTVGNTSGNVFDYNRFFTIASPGNAVDYNGTNYGTIEQYISDTGQDGHSSFGSPMFVDTSASSLNLRLLAGSQCIDAGNNSVVTAGDTDLSGGSRIQNGTVDLGAYEYTPQLLPSQPPALVGVIGSFPHYTFAWRSVSGADSFAFAIGPNPALTDSIIEINTTDTTVSIDSLLNGSRYYWRVRSHNTAGYGLWSPVWSFIAGTGTISTSLVNGWNITSLPINDSTSTVAKSFPTAVSAAYRFNGGYTTSDSLKPGIGYWIKVNGAQPLNFNGILVDSLEIPVSVGWNLIGTLGSPIDAAAIQASGTSIISQFFEFASGYRAATQLLPGKGYWVKVDGSGMLLFH